MKMTSASVLLCALLLTTTATGQTAGQRYFARQHLEGLSQTSADPSDGVDVSAFVAARERMLAGIVAYQAAERAKPGAPAEVAAAGYLAGLPSAGSYGAVSGSYIAISRSFADYLRVGHSPAFHIGGLSEEVCSAINAQINGRSYVPEWPESESGCFYWGDDRQHHFYAYAPAGPAIDEEAIATEFVAIATTMAQAVSGYEAAHGASRPSDIEALVSSGSLDAVPSVRGVSTMQNGFIGIARDASEYNSVGEQPAWSMSGVSDAVCRGVNARIAGRSYIPVWPENQAGCFYWATSGRNHVYGYLGLAPKVSLCGTRSDGTSTCKS